MALSLSPGLLEPDTNLAIGVRIDRANGLAIGLSSHDRPVRVGGVLYASDPGIEVSAIKSATPDDPFIAEVSGPFSDGSLTPGIVEAGELVGARVAIMLFDWRQTGHPAMQLGSGIADRVQHDGRTYRFEIRSHVGWLSAGTLPAYSSLCRAVFTDDRCRFPRHELEILDRVAGLNRDESRLLLSISVPQGGNRPRVIRVLSGECSGDHLQILKIDGLTVKVRIMPAGLSIGDRVAIIGDCDKQFITCRSLFNNHTNFRGEPDLPGGDAIARYPI